MQGRERPTCARKARSGEATRKDLGGVDGDKFGGDELDVITHEHLLHAVVVKRVTGGADHLPAFDPELGIDLVELGDILADRCLLAQVVLRGREAGVKIFSDPSQTPCLHGTWTRWTGLAREKERRARDKGRWGWQKCAGGESYTRSDALVDLLDVHGEF